MDGIKYKIYKFYIFFELYEDNLFLLFFYVVFFDIFQISSDSFIFIAIINIRM